MEGYLPGIDPEDPEKLTDRKSLNMDKKKILSQIT